jgi:hypothetical protein
VSRLGRRLGCERGEGIVSGLILLAGVLIPLVFLVPLYARLEQGKLAATQAARDAVRAATASPNADAAAAAAEQALERARATSRTPLRLTLSGEFGRGAVLRAEVGGEVALASLPFVGRVGTVVVQASASAPVDRYRSLAPTQAP